MSRMKLHILVFTIILCSSSLLDAAVKKTIAIPFLQEKVAIDGRLDDAVWQQAAQFNDMVVYRKPEKADGETQVFLWYDSQNIYLGIRAQERAKIHADNKADGTAVWQGDRIEVFFGKKDPDAWVRQYAIGAGGGRFSYDGNNSKWRGAVALGETNWTAEIAIPFSEIPVRDFNCGFNICRSAVERKENSLWSPVNISFYELENYGEIFFLPYEKMLQARFNLIAGDEKMNRADYEAFAEKNTPSALATVHGPWLHHPDTGAVSISWRSASNCAGRVEWRKGENGAISRVNADVADAVAPQNLSIHTAQLEGLEPEELYFYRVVNIAAQDRQLLRGAHEEASKWIAFRAPGKKAENGGNFSFAFTSDIHNNAAVLKKILNLPAVQACDFFVNGGDMTSSLLGERTIFDGYLDVECENFAKTKPLVHVRGNHELHGISAGLDREFFPSPSGKTYGMFRVGDVCFLQLDGGEDQAPELSLKMLAEERRWLAEAVRSEALRSASRRIVLCHLPITFFDEGQYGYSNAIMKALGDILVDPENRIDLMISGHRHCWSFTQANSDGAISGDDRFAGVPTRKLPFPVLCNDGPGFGGVDASVCIVDIKAGNIANIRILNENGKTIFTYPNQ